MSTRRRRRDCFSIPEFFSSACCRLLLLIAVRPRNSTIRCFLLYFSRTPALPFPMVAPVPAQIPNLRPRSPAAPLRRRALPLLATHYPLSTLFLSALCFHILTNCFSRNSFILTTIRIAPGCGGTNLQSLSELCASAPLPSPTLSGWQIHCFQAFAASFPPLCALFCTPSLCFQSLAASFRKIPGVGYPECNYGTPGWGVA